jgi:hypothetical protein
MRASPSEPEPAEDVADDDRRPVMRASPPEGGEDDAAREETIEEPGYGHGV